MGLLVIPIAVDVMVDPLKNDEAGKKLPGNPRPTVEVEAPATGSVHVKALAPSSVKANGPDFFEELDRMAHAGVAKATAGLAPSVLGEAWMDWAVHLAMSPGTYVRQK